MSGSKTGKKATAAGRKPVKEKEKLPVNTPRWSGRTLAAAKKP